VLAALKANPSILAVKADVMATTSMMGYDGQVEQLKKNTIGTVAGSLCLSRIPGDSRSTICDVADTYQYGSDITNLVAKAFMYLTPTADIGIQVTPPR
jgi:5'-nucleotidase